MGLKTWMHLPLAFPPAGKPIARSPMEQQGQRQLALGAKMQKKLRFKP